MFSASRTRYYKGFDMKYDLVVPTATKDYLKILHSVPRMQQFLNPAPENIYIVAKHKINIGTFIHEDEILPIKVSDIKYRRAPWIYQQVIKLCQDFTENDNYLCMDSDIFLNKSVSVFLEDKPVFFRTRPQCHQPYFTFMKKVFNLERVWPETFIADITFFKKSVCREIIPNIQDFVHKLNEVISDDCLLGEPEVYGNYIQKYYPGTYGFSDLKMLSIGRYLPDQWEQSDIEFELDNLTEYFDALAMHSWT